ncbi:MULTISPECIES: hypothetical protein [Rhodococcus]|uniref:Uncharacterized protein n=1 Tax=Rhodococcus oxybenzonivorans TaxID=1990687 RepID=A0AAE4V0E8_9NOCA|nr:MULTISPECIES: hypothetical protein [Rhodococcus]MDV7240579.1 hypothetical protein [Rhodococcus oxybenzonivorans]MDV7265726.1 hypothetical protein [Rhodococcus oxybenzonivorans]MDV7272852.1 hypothetical protein [Rhodococcus oxybenzonivorans]MDV7333409.1 hypothetical protein [Rhodococcus oxybenzonivorans]MDV7342576.1 hypothetical protein [Rhodococcus oxybenzonivorans]
MLDKLYALFLSSLGLSFGGYILLDEVADQVDRLTTDTGSNLPDPEVRSDAF